MKELSKVKEDYEQSVDNPYMGLKLKIEIKKKNPIKKELRVDFNLESTFGNTIR